MKKLLTSKLDSMKYIVLFNLCLLGLGVILLDKQEINVLFTWGLGILGYGIVAISILLAVVSQLNERSIRKIKKFLYN